MLNALQYVDTCKSREEAEQEFAFLAIQVDYLGGRIIDPSGPGWWETEAAQRNHVPIWKVQVLFEHDGLNEGWLPDGLSRVLVPDSVKRVFNIQ